MIQHCTVEEIGLFEYAAERKSERRGREEAVIEAGMNSRNRVETNVCCDQTKHVVDVVSWRPMRRLGKHMIPR